MILDLSGNVVPRAPGDVAADGDVEPQRDHPEPQLHDFADVPLSSDTVQHHLQLGQSHKAQQQHQAHSLDAGEQPRVGHRRDHVVREPAVGVVLGYKPWVHN